MNSQSSCNIGVPKVQLNNWISNVRCWTLSGNESKDEAITAEELKSRFGDIAKKSGVNGTTESPTFLLFTVCGDPVLRDYPELPGRSPIKQADIGFDFLNNLFPRSVHIRSVSPEALRPIFVSYRDDGSITAVIRMGPSLRAMFCVMKIYTHHRGSVSFVSCRHPADLADFRGLCRAEQDVLRTTPLGLLSVLYDQKVRCWERWGCDLYTAMNGVEVYQGMAPEGWDLYPPSGDHVKELANGGDSLNRQFAQINSQISHGHSMAAFGIRFAHGCLEAIDVVEKTRKSQELLLPGQRAMVEDRIWATKSLCQALLERFEDLGDRLRGLISITSNAIAQQEMRNSSTVAKSSLEVSQRAAVDGRITKVIAALGLTFLPNSFTSSLWEAKIFEFEGRTNAVVYTSVTAVLTLLVMACGGLYMRSTVKPLGLRRSGLGDLSISFMV